MNQFDQWNREWLLFNRNSRRAILIFVALSAVCIGGIKFYFFIYHPRETVEIQITTTEKEFVKELKEINHKKKQSFKRGNRKSKYKIPKAKFNPNDYTVEDWVNLSFSQKQANAIMNYQASGFEFKVKRDLLKLFVIDEAYYSKVKSLIALPDSIASSYQYEKPKLSEKNIELVSINDANKNELTMLKGIGDYYAERIINYRTALGGFYKLSQLKEVYHLPDSLVDHLSDVLTIDTTHLSRYNINKIKKGELNKHPYISYKLANSIIAYRNTHGNYNSVDELKKLILMDGKTFKKVKPYLSVE